jgi:hypothetical protein
MTSCMSCKYVNPLLLTHPAVCCARLSASASAASGSATYLVHVAAAAYFVCLITETDPPFFAAGTRPSRPCVIWLCEKGLVVLC